MAWPASRPGWQLETQGDLSPRVMTISERRSALADRTRLTGLFALRYLLRLLFWGTYNYHCIPLSQFWMFVKDYCVPASRRFRLRLKPTDCETIDAILRMTNLRTQSRSVRAALTVYHSLGTAESEGFSLFLYHSRTQEKRKMIPSAQSKNVHLNVPCAPDRFLELRLSAADIDLLDAIRKVTGVRNVSKIIREALTQYLSILNALRDEFFVVAISPAGDIFKFPLAIPWKPDEAAQQADVGLRYSLEHSKISRRNRRTLSLPMELVEELQRLALSGGIRWDDIAVDILRKAVAIRNKTNEGPSLKDSLETLDVNTANFFDFPEEPLITLHSANASCERTRRETDVDEGLLPVQEMLFPLPAASGPSWALVLSQDELGRPQQQIVKSDAIVPLSQEDLECF